jgi:hypothetical protein
MPAECFAKYRIDHPFSAFVLMASAALVSPVVARDRNLPDQAVSDAVEKELVSDRVVPMIKLDVKTHDGIVTLTGTVANLLAKTRGSHRDHGKGRVFCRKSDSFRA